MTLSDFRRITDELLSAYIDGEVTEQERTLIEAAIAADEEIAWRLNSLRQTVNLLRDLPELALPRSFTLSLDQARIAQADEKMAGVGATEQSPVAAPTPRIAPNLVPKAAPQSGASGDFWGRLQQAWRDFWQAGNPMLRNAAAVSFAVMLLLASGGQLLNRAISQPAGMMSASAPMAPAPAADSAASEAAPAAEAVALAPTPTEEVTALQVQDESAANKTPSDESARIMQSEAAAPAGEIAEESAADSAQAAPASDTAESAMTESVVAEGEVTEEAAEEGAVAAAGAEAASDAHAEENASEAEEPAAAIAAMAVPEQPQADEALPPEPQAPVPNVARGQSGGGGDVPPGMGGGAGGEAPGMEMAPGAADPGVDLIPGQEQQYGFETDPLAPTAEPAEEAVIASAAAAPAEEAPEQEVADAPATPAVDAPVALSTVVATEMPADDGGAAAGNRAPEATVPATDADTTTASVVAGSAIEPTVEPTPEAVALVAPEGITSSAVVQNAPSDAEGIVPAAGPAGNLPVVWVAQGTVLLLTIMLTTLWWRSRTPRRPRK